MRNLFLLIFNSIAFTCCAQTDSSMLKTQDNPGETLEDTNEKIFAVVEQMPEFPSGEAAMMKFIAENLVYPSIAKDNDIESTIILRFIVKSTGEITNIDVLNKEKIVGFGLKEEAIRVIKIMPKWKPGKQNGQPVSVYYYLPIRFELR